MWPFKIKEYVHKKHGLEVKFRAGENLPWKGIMFEVKKVLHDEITLSPIGLTWQMAKKLKDVKGV